MDKNKRGFELKCEACNSDFLLNTVEIKEKDVSIENNSFTVIYYKCPECGVIQIVGMLDYRAKRIRDSYFAAYDQVKKMELTGSYKINRLLYEKKKEKVEKLKKQNTDYQEHIIKKYLPLLESGDFDFEGDVNATK